MTAQTILPANSAVSGGYEVANSLRFNSGSSDSLTKTLGTPTDNKKWTYSFWVKQCSNIGNVLNTGSDTAYIYFRPNDADPAPSGFSIEQYVSSFQYRIIPNMVFRDHSAWRHIVIAFDTTQGTDTNRVKVYNNGTQITSFNTATYPSQNLDTQVNSAVSHKIGGLTGGTSQNLDGYLSEVCFIDGQQLAADQFGEFDEDSEIWKPIDVSGLTFGDNGFYLEFKQAGTGTNASGMGADTSGNDNHFAVANLTAIDQTTDTCTNNFATMNPLSSGMTLTEGNLNVANSGGKNAVSTFSVASGKWYVEMKATNAQTYNPIVGIATDNSTAVTNPASTDYPGNFAESHGYDRTGTITSSNATDQGSLTTSQSDNDIIGLAVDLDSGTKTAQWYVNGSSVGSAVTLVSDESYVFMTYSSGSQSGTGAWNFGNPTYANSSSVSDGNGFGDFEYAPPSGFLSLCTKNIGSSG